MKMYQNHSPFNRFESEDNDDMQIIWHSSDITSIEGYNESQFVYDPVTAMPSDEDLYELPLLEELEIYPEKIFKRISITLNPFTYTDIYEPLLMSENDLAGPLFFYLILGFSLFLSGSQAHFSYIYGLTITSSLAMFILLSLICPDSKTISFIAVTSILGYSLVPVVLLSILGIMVPLRNIVGIILGGMAIIWSGYSASKLFVSLAGDKEQQMLAIYPSCLIFGMYTLLILY